MIEFTPDEQPEYIETHTLEDRANWQLTFIERLAELSERSIYDEFQEDVIKAISKSFSIFAKIQNQITKDVST